MFASTVLVITDQTQKGKGDSARRNKLKRGHDINIFLIKRQDFIQLWGTSKDQRRNDSGFWRSSLREKGGKKGKKRNLELLRKFHPISETNQPRTTRNILLTTMFFHTRTQSYIQPLQVLHLLGFKRHVPKGSNINSTHAWQELWKRIRRLNVFCIKSPGSHATRLLYPVSLKRYKARSLCFRRVQMKHRERPPALKKFKDTHFKVVCIQMLHLLWKEHCQGYNTLLQNTD